jgi:ketosteroid isomerase-like protein
MKEHASQTRPGGAHARSDEAQIRALLENWAAHVRAKDMAGVLAHHAGDIVMFNVPEPTQWNGVDRYQDALQLYFDNTATPAPYDLSEVVIRASDGLAFAHGLLRCGGGGEKWSDTPLITVRLTTCFEKRGDEWVFVHEHHSLAVKPKTESGLKVT